MFGTIDDNGAIFLQNNNQVWLKNVYVSYTQLYDLEFDVWLDANTTIIHHYKYKFFPQDSIIENGVIIESGDTFFNGLDMSQLIIGTLPNESGENGSGILGGIAQLLLPGDDPLSQWVNNYLLWADSHLGMIWKPFEFILLFLNRILNIDYSNKVMELGPYKMPLFNNVTLVNKITFDFDTFCPEGSVFETIHNYYYIIVDGIIIFALIKLLQHEFKKIVGGQE